MERRSEPGFVGSANQHLVSTLTQNLGDMDLVSRWDAVSAASGSNTSLAQFGVLSQFLVFVCLSWTNWFCWWSGSRGPVPAGGPPSWF